MQLYLDDLASNIAGAAQQLLGIDLTTIAITSTSAGTSTVGASASPSSDFRIQFSEDQKGVSPCDACPCIWNIYVFIYIYTHAYI